MKSSKQNAKNYLRQFLTRQTIKGNNGSYFRGTYMIFCTRILSKYNKMYDFPPFSINVSIKICIRTIFDENEIENQIKVFFENLIKLRYQIANKINI